MLSAYQDTVYRLQNTAENYEKIEPCKGKVYFFKLICVAWARWVECSENLEYIGYD